MLIVNPCAPAVSASTAVLAQVVGVGGSSGTKSRGALAAQNLRRITAPVASRTSTDHYTLRLADHETTDDRDVNSGPTNPGRVERNADAWRRRNVRDMTGRTPIGRASSSRMNACWNLAAPQRSHQVRRLSSPLLRASPGTVSDLRVTSLFSNTGRVPRKQRSRRCRKPSR
jgi:hypothetical protein